MLSFSRPGRAFCDGIHRRDFLKIGAFSAAAMGCGGFTLADVLRAESEGLPRGKSFINIHLNGGPSHLDMFDMKPDAPPEIRGEFSPIPTNVPGVEISNFLPKLSKLADKYSIIRSITGIRDEHAPNQSESGFSMEDLKNVGGRPSIGSVVAKLHGLQAGDVPRFIDIAGFSNPGFLGSIYGGYKADGNGRENLQVRNELKEERMHSRGELLSQLDTMKRGLDRSRTMDAVDSFQQRAVDVVLGGKMAKALDWEKNESAEVKERYGLKYDQNGEQRRWLLARRMIEVGARVVSLGFTGWDTHANNFIDLKGRLLPQFDNGLSALIADLSERGMLQDTLIMVTGEFGRTPRINNQAGRDHWSRASFCFLAGGGLKHGQVIGSTDRFGEAPEDRPVHIGEVFSTLYQYMGINPKTTTIVDNNGRPQYLTQNSNVIRELV